MRFQLVADEALPDFLDLPWSQPLEEWESARLVDVVRGISRHAVRFVHYDGSIFAVKEINPRLARREYRLLRDLADHAVPVVEAIGVVSDRPDGLEAILITRHLDYSLPYRTLFSGHGVPNLREHLSRRARRAARPRASRRLLLGRLLVVECVVPQGCRRPLGIPRRRRDG